jgi:ParB/RepB/Spo0J family partition protein
VDLGTHESRGIPIGLLNEPEMPSRTEMDDAKLAALAEDIRVRGIVQHLIVFPVADRYEIVAGHRRYTAARMAGLAFVPCDVYPSRDAADEGVQFAENEYREKLNRRRRSGMVPLATDTEVRRRRGQALRAAQTHARARGASARFDRPRI